MFRKVNLDNYKRINTFNFYKNFEDPFFNITCNVDVTGLYEFCKKKKHSFFLATLHTCTKAANEIPELKQRIVGDEIREFECVHPGSTILKDDETFTFGYFNYQNEFENFHADGINEITSRKNNSSLEPEVGRNDLIYFTTIPWVSFTQFKHARSGQRESIPRIVVGKYFRQGERLLMPISIEVHHALVDGIHVGKFIELLNKRLASF